MTRHYPTDFKMQVVKLYESQLLSRKDIVAKYNISPSTLDRWILNSQEKNATCVRNSCIKATEELSRARQQLKRLNEEKSILKQATIILATS